MEVSTSAYYSWTKQPETTEKILETKRLEAKIHELFDEFRQSYGSRRLSNELRKAGFNIGRYQTRTLMKRLGLIVRYPKKFKVTTDSNHNEAISPNKLNRKFDVMVPNKVWTTDTSAPCGYYIRLDARRLAICGDCYGFVFPLKGVYGQANCGLGY
jgi:hypothetical protein